MCRFCRDLMQPGLLMSNWPIRSSVAEDIWLQTTWLPIHFVIFLPVPMVATCTYASGLRPTKQRFSMILQRCKPARWGSAIHTHADPWRIPRPALREGHWTKSADQDVACRPRPGLVRLPPGLEQTRKKGMNKMAPEFASPVECKKVAASWVHVRLQVVHKISATYASRMPRIYKGKQMNTIEIQRKSRTHVSSQMIFHSKSEEYIPVSQHLIGLTVNQLAGSWSIPLRRVDWPWSR
jgi:hypothetical protein